MAERLLDSSLVLLTLTAVYLLPTWPAVRRLLPKRSGWDTLLTAAALGIASQGILGFVWVLLGVRNPGLESLLYLGGWTAFSLASFMGVRGGRNAAQARSLVLRMFTVNGRRVAPPGYYGKERRRFGPPSERSRDAWSRETRSTPCAVSSPSPS